MFESFLSFSGLALFSDDAQAGKTSYFAELVLGSIKTFYSGIECSYSKWPSLGFELSFSVINFRL